MLILILAISAFARTTLASCTDDLLARIAVPPNIPRLTYRQFSKNVYALTEGDQALTCEAPARVITDNGTDLLIAINAGLARAEGLGPFFKRLGFAQDSTTAGWVDKVQSYYERYLYDDFPIRELASLWRPENLLWIDRVFFARFFTLMVTINPQSRPQFYVGPEKADRLALLSLKNPAFPEVRPPSITSDLNRANQGTKPTDVRPHRLDSIYFQLPRAGERSRVVTWDVAETSKPGKTRRPGFPNEKWFRQNVEVADLKRKLSREDVVYLTYLEGDQLAGEPVHALAFEIRYIERFGEEIISIASASEISITELLSLEGEFNSKHLPLRPVTPEEAYRRAQAKERGSPVTGQIRLADSLMQSIPQLTTYMAAWTQWLVPSLENPHELETLRPGEMRSYILTPDKIPKFRLSPRFKTRGITIYRDINGHLYLVAVALINS